MNQNRWKSPVALGAIAAQLLALLVALDILNITQSETINTAIAALLQVLAVFGVLNNPTDKNNF